MRTAQGVAKGRTYSGPTRPDWKSPPKGGSGGLDGDKPAKKGPSASAGRKR